MIKYVYILIAACAVSVIFLFAIKMILLNEHEKRIILYLDVVNSIFYEARQTRSVVVGSEKGILNAEEAVNITNNAIKKILSLDVPTECITFKTLCINSLDCLMKYHTLRMDETRIPIRDVEMGKLSNAQLSFEEQKFRENFRILHKIGGLKVFIYRLTHKSVLCQ